MALVAPLPLPNWSHRGQCREKANVIGARGLCIDVKYDSIAFPNHRSQANPDKTVFQILTTFLFLGFLLTAMGGIMLKTSTGTLQSIVMVATNECMIDADDLCQIAVFLIEVVDAMATYSIVIGVVLAVLCLISLIASCCGWNKMLKLYAGILIVLLVVQITVATVVFSKPTKFVNAIVSSMEALLKSYGDGGKEGNRSTAIWNLLMETTPKCCGMDGYKDFEKPDKDLPLPCCNITSGDCDAMTAESAGVAGCRS
ncbi:Tetraspanin-6 [Taenia crassiceps]|uniref:Tetraspanin-6 n=1 Tax=Taenia crassiceps TaxID=6207 RepID=A0ABR4Q3B1_9CEST